MSLVWSAASANVYDELTATLSFNDDNINLVYIDWDDGEYNKLNESNYQWVHTPDPSGAISVKHTYTATGTFYPVVQTVTSEGFVSRYYSAVAASATDVTPHTIDTAVSGVTIADNDATAIMRVENRTVKSGIDNSIFDDGAKKIYLTIPPLISQDNIGSITNPKLEIEVLLAGGLYDSTGSGMGVDVGTTASYRKLNFAVSASGTGMYDILSGTSVSGAAVSRILSVKYLNPRPSDRTYAKYAIYNKLKIFIVASGASGFDNEVGVNYDGWTGAFYPITYVSAGSPIKKADDMLRSVTLDFSQGRSAASNTYISKYYYDNGKSWFNPINQWRVGKVGYTNPSVDLDTANIFGDLFGVYSQTSPLKKVTYTYMPQPTALNGTADGLVSSGNATALSNSGNAYWFTSGSLGTLNNQAIRTDQFAIDDFGRFYDQYHFVRNSAQPNSSVTTGGVPSYVSPISGNQIQADIFQPSTWADPAIAPYLQTSSQSPLTPKIWTNTWETPIYVRNSESPAINLSVINTSSSTWSPIVDYAGNVNTNAKFYMIILAKKKTNKYFFAMSPYAQGLQYNATSTTNKRLGIGGIYYLNIENSGTIRQNCSWKPLQYEDTTKITKEIRDTTNGKYSTSGASFAKSGYISFDMPSDWDSISWTNICGGVYNDSGSAPGGEGNPWVFPSSSTDMWTGPLEVVDIGNCPGYGAYVTTEITSGDMLKESFGDNAEGANELGAWKSIFYCTSGSVSGAAFWIASGADNGWKGASSYDNKLTLMFGESGAASTVPNMPAITGDLYGYIRRINAYEVLDGTWKGYSGSTNVIVPVGMNLYDPDNFDYINNTWNAADQTGVNLFDGASNKPLNWANEDLYALKIVFDGESSSGSSADAGGAAPILNNLFAANESFTAIIKEVDDTAYSLNTLPITSEISYARDGTFYRVITRKGKVFIAKTGIGMQNLSFESVALGDESGATVSGTAADSLYGYLHKVRRLFEETVRVYWDEKQKDGTYVRFWGIITNVNETHGTAGPRNIRTYSFDMAIEEIALLDDSGELMTDIFPLGGIKDERNFT